MKVILRVGLNEYTFAARLIRSVLGGEPMKPGDSRVFVFGEGVIQSAFSVYCNKASISVWSHQADHK